MVDGAGKNEGDAFAPDRHPELRKPEVSERSWPLAERPGFLIRRLHQIHVSLFAERCGAFGITPLQYSLLSELLSRIEADQTTLANAVALDRTTTTGALRRLEARGLVSRTTSTADRRAQSCRLTEEGIKIHNAMADAARQAHEATVAVLSSGERQILTQLMKKVAVAHGQRHEAADL
ncbi:MarR family winged helix-turn-helix transcriptional regulator [Methylobacterium radiodurans]|uniref:MarR family transcriptional regulator n=1 Tax=Methylobacterium radiodurans TaxID=2202828 RepID=A0A2U8VZG3_9HYPH|nr:MarR family transcriptional regulator [Methylobacterium radiodurans]AWN39203.1 MarR family transcriptional regulator [Methylobacterium radiodurans]